MQNEKCFCHFNGYEVKDAKARRDIESLNTEVETLSENVTSNNTSLNTMTNDITKAKTDIESIKNSISAINTSVSTNTNSIQSINENIIETDSKIGSMEVLNTTDKSSLVNAINEVKANVDNLEVTGGVSDEEIQEQIKAIRYEHVVDGLRVYIDGVNGNDDTGDGTESNPYKTIDKFFDLANYVDGGRNDIRCYIVSAGEYTLSKHSIGHLTIHITGQVDGVILNFTTDRDMKFYECHTNLDNLTIRYPNATEFAFDGGSIAITKCTFEGEVKTYSCCGVFKETTLKNIQAFYSNITLYKMMVTNTDPTIAGYFFDNSNVRSYSSTDFASLSSTADNNIGLFTCICSRVLIQWKPSAKSNKYAYGFYGYGNIVFITSDRLEALKSNFTNGVGGANEQNLFVTEEKTSIL